MEMVTMVGSREDRDIRKKTMIPGDYNVVPLENATCEVVLSNVNIKSVDDFEHDSVYLKEINDGPINITLGDADNYVDKDFELILQQMCKGEQCAAQFTYKNSKGSLVKQVSFNVELKQVSEEELVSDWDWSRLYSMAQHHKDRGVQLVKDKHILEAFRRFNKAFKFIIAMEPIDPILIAEDKIKDIIDTKVKLYNNLAHCQLQYNEYDAALELSNRSLQLEPDNVKGLYRRCLSYSGLKMYEEAWQDVQDILKIDPQDKAVLQKANELKPKIDRINNDYANVVKKMFTGTHV